MCHEISAAFDLVRQQNPVLASVHDVEIRDRIVDVERFAALGTCQKRPMLVFGAPSDAIHVDGPRWVVGKGAKSQGVDSQWQEMARSPCRVCDQLNTRVKIRQNLVEISESVQSVTVLGHSRGPQLANDADRSSTLVVQSLNALQVSEIVRIQTEREEQVVFLDHADLMIARPSLLPEERVDPSGDSIVAAGLIGNRREHIDVVAIANYVFKFVASTSRDVMREVAHREQQHPSRAL